jgi:hypothetical protein
MTEQWVRCLVIALRTASSLRMQVTSATLGALLGLKPQVGSHHVPALFLAAHFRHLTRRRNPHRVPATYPLSVRLLTLTFQGRSIQRTGGER